MPVMRCDIQSSRFLLPYLLQNVISFGTAEAVSGKSCMVQASGSPRRALHVFPCAHIIPQTPKAGRIGAVVILQMHSFVTVRSLQRLAQVTDEDIRIVPCVCKLLQSSCCFDWTHAG